MYFLVDFENVRSGGLRGVDYLDNSDYLTIFFSNAAHSCENRYLEDIERSGCHFDTCKLKNTGKNGLDFSVGGLSQRHKRRRQSRNKSDYGTCKRHKK